MSNRCEQVGPDGPDPLVDTSFGALGTKLTEYTLEKFLRGKQANNLNLFTTLQTPFEEDMLQGSVLYSDVY